MNRVRIESLANRVQSAGRRLRAKDGGGEPASDWAGRRGEQRYSGTFDVIGNFPGFEDCAGLIVNAEIAVTTRYLIVDEGEPHGFALGIGWLVEVSADGDPETFGDILVRYRHDDADILFRLRPGRARLPLRTRNRPEDLVAALSDVGAEAADLARDVSNALRLNWDSVQSLESESVVWRGEATAPLRPGLESAPATVWVTPTALVWGSVRGSGVNRLPLSTVTRLSSMSLNDDAGSPTVYVRTRVISDIRLDLPFIFNLGAIRDGIAGRAEFLGLFRPESVLEGVVSDRPQPWLDEPPATTPEPAGDDETEVDSEQSDESTASEDDGIAPEVPVFETWANVARPDASPYVPPADGAGLLAHRRIDREFLDADEPEFDSSGTRLVDAISSWPGSLPAPSESTETETPLVTQPDVIIRYMADAHRAINEVNEAIDRRIAGNAAPLLRATPPSSEDQARALVELIELTGSDYYSVEQARSVKARITRYGEAAVRLRSLIELCNAGHLTIAEVGAKRDSIVANLPAAEDGE
jgi:hypothetical protein